MSAISSYNVTEGILPFTSYDFQVSVCNAIGCGAFTDIVTVTTDEDGESDTLVHTFQYVETLDNVLMPIQQLLMQPQP
jgi:hypothetical protein